MFLPKSQPILVSSFLFWLASSVVYGQPSDKAWKTFRADFGLSARANVNFQPVPHRLDTAYQKLLIPISFGQKIRTPIITSNGMLLVTLDGGKIVALVDPDGNELDTIGISETMHEPPILVRDDLALAADESGKIYSIQVGSNALSRIDRLTFKTATQISMVLVDKSTVHMIGSDSKVRELRIQPDGKLNLRAEIVLPGGTSPKTDLVHADGKSYVATKDKIFIISSNPLDFRPLVDSENDTWIMASPTNSKLWIGSHTLVREFDTGSDELLRRIPLEESKSKKLRPVFSEDNLVLFGNSFSSDSTEIITISSTKEIKTIAGVIRNAI